MKISELISKLGLKMLTAEIKNDREIKGCYICDLLSWVMTKAEQDNVWITVQTNINIVAVATLTDVSCIIIPENIELDVATIEKANAQDIVILSSDKTGYELAKMI